MSTHNDQVLPPEHQNAEPNSANRNSVAHSDAPSDTPRSDAASGHRRNGHIARLPKEIRQRINEMLDDGLPYLEIIQNLGEHGKHLNEDMMTRWKAGGYQDYLKEQFLLKQCLARQQSASTLLASDNHINTFQAAQQIAANQICATITDMGPDALRQAIATSPLNYFRMLNAFARLTTGGLKCERQLLENRERKALLKRSNSRRKKGISKQSVKEMKDKLSLM